MFTFPILTKNNFYYNSIFLKNFFTLIAIICSITMDDLTEAEKLLRKGRIEAKEENYSDAIKLFHEALKCEPDNKDTLFQLGIAYHNIADYKNTIFYLEKLLPPVSNNLVIWRTLGHSYQMLQDYRKAIHSYKKALEFNPDHQEKEMIMSIIDNLIFKVDYSD
ncbi:MAG: tetratricopeptide repeat protein [Asgard group archaeon]|nr:tetratricopeptide repeat protein [Asgard group archaeon]